MRLLVGFFRHVVSAPDVVVVNEVVGTACVELVVVGFDFTAAPVTLCFFFSDDASLEQSLLCPDFVVNGELFMVQTYELTKTCISSLWELRFFSSCCRETVKRYCFRAQTYCDV